MKEQMGGAHSQMVTDQSQTAPKGRLPQRTQDLRAGQRSLLELMQEHQFGRIENMPVRAGEPILNSDVRVVRVARLGSESDGTKLVANKESELKKQVRDLFKELARLENGTVIRLEFRYGLPFLLETTERVIQAAESPLSGEQIQR
jgi:hypothetical protein